MDGTVHFFSSALVHQEWKKGYRISYLLILRYRISWNIGRDFLPENLPESHPSIYIPVIGTIFVVIWQPGSLPGPSKPRRHHSHRHQSDALPSFFFNVAFLAVGERVGATFSLFNMYVQALCSSSPQHLKENLYSLTNLMAECPTAASSVLPKWVHATSASWKGARYATLQRPRFVGAEFCTWNCRTRWLTLSASVMRRLSPNKWPVTTPKRLLATCADCLSRWSANGVVCLVLFSLWLSLVSV